MALEQQIQNRIVKYLESIGCKVVKVIVANKKGIADIIVCYRGYYLEFEVKAPGKRATKLQELQGKKTLEAGGFWQVVTYVDEVEECIDFIERIKQC